MPHLDICTFAVQYNWTALTFLGLYFIVVVNLIPSIGTSLHLRKKCSVVKDTTLSKGPSEKTDLSKAGLL